MATYRPDLYCVALAPLQAELPIEDTKVEGLRATASSGSVGTLAIAPDGFFDGKVFDPSDLLSYLDSLR